jgi:thiamine-phosphate pyrophosphorylase
LWSGFQSGSRSRHAFGLFELLQKIRRRALQFPFSPGALLSPALTCRPTNRHPNFMNFRTPLAQARLYAIVDLDYIDSHRAPAMAESLIEGGADLLQLRAKNETPETLEPLARAVQKVCRRHAVPFIINDHAELAARIEADGCHVGQDDLSVTAVRQMLAPGTLVGLSTHSFDQARAALARGPDYIGFGPLFATPTKPEYAAIGLSDIARVHQEVSLPIFCIGGIKPWNLEEVLQAGARRAVLVSALLQAPDPAELTRQVRRQILRAPQKNKATDS